MQGVTLIGTGIVLVGTVAVGLIAHELAHALALYRFGVPFEIRWFPGDGRSRQEAGRLSGTWASVTPSRIPSAVPAWGIQLSALAPLALTLPVVVLAGGVLPFLSMDNPYVAAMTVAWLACSIPSPQDFSVFWYADAAVAKRRETPTLDE
jgi:hypothetical protein